VVLTLTPGATYVVKGGELPMLAGSTLIGGAGQPDAAATVNISGQFITESGVFITNLLVNSTNTGGQAIQIFNNSLITDAVINTLGNFHPHTGTQLRGTTELVAATFHDIQPITNESKPPVDVCACPPGFKFLLTVPVSADDRVCVPSTD